MLLQILESRLDNVVYRLGLANTRREARQLVNHGHITLNGHKADIPSILVKPGDVVAVREKSKSSVRIKEIVEVNSKRVIPAWLDMNRDTLVGKVIRLSEREEIDFEVAEHLIVELYSK
jgi:small subunit ribosomal protein S4